MKQDILLVRQEVTHLEQVMTLKFEAFDRNLDVRLQALQYDLVIKLSIVMTALFATAGSLLALLR